MNRKILTINQTQYSNMPQFTNWIICDRKYVIPLFDCVTLSSRN